MTRSAPRTWSTSELVTAAMMNTVRDNLNDGWPYTAANQIAVSTAANAISKIDAGSEGNILGISGGVPTYIPIASIITSILSARTTSAISTDTTSISYIDVPNSSVTVSPTATCNILLLASANLTSGTGGSEYIRGVIDNVDQAESINIMTAGQVLQWTYFSMRTSVGTGPRVIKLKYKSLGGQDVNIYNGVLMAIVLPN